MKRLVSLLVSATILALIYFQIDWGAFARVLQAASGTRLALSLGMVVPITGITAWRLQLLVPNRAQLQWHKACQLTLAASSLNMVLPSKMGDIAKAYFIQRRGILSGSLSLSLMVFEKVCDLLSLLFWGGVGGLLLAQPGWGLQWAGAAMGTIVAAVTWGILSQSVSRSFFQLARQATPLDWHSKLGHLNNGWSEMQKYLHDNPKQSTIIAMASIGLWWLHIVQIWLFVWALDSWVPLTEHIALVPLAILAGLLPLTFAGIGTRDAALAVLYEPYFALPTAVALGMLCTSRYVLPALGGLPYLSRYLRS